VSILSEVLGHIKCSKHDTDTLLRQNSANESRLRMKKESSKKKVARRGGKSGGDY